MQSRLWQSGRSSAICRSLDLLLLVLVLVAQPEDWRGSRGNRTGARGEWNTTPKDNWWQYRCPVDGCKEFFQSWDMPTYPIFCRNGKHRTRVKMNLDHNPRTG
jgi:hypothetical protein